VASQEHNHLPARRWQSPETERAFRWFTLPRSTQVARLEEAMRNYNLPVYDMIDVGRHLMRVLMLPLCPLRHETPRVDMMNLAQAVIEFAVGMGWDVVEEARITQRDSGN
jgi:hypothetical protein